MGRERAWVGKGEGGRQVIKIGEKGEGMPDVFNVKVIKRNVKKEEACKVVCKTCKRKK